MSNTEDVIEISDDSDPEDLGKAGTSGYCMKRPLAKVVSISDSEDSSDNEVQLISDGTDSEPDLDCELWDEDCIIVNKEVTTKLIQGIHHVKFISLPIKSPKRMKIGVELNDNLCNEIFFKTIQDNYTNDNAFEEKNCELFCDPWKVLVINNVLEDSSILDRIYQEFSEVDWNLRTMDLYEFCQSEDLKNIHAENIALIYDFMKGSLMEWVAKLTGLELVSISATCSYYSDTDFLLVHDDQRGTRAIAFVLYLTGKEGWSVDWGGCLQLLNCDEERQPLDVARNIQPRHNQLVLFPVSDKSYHQVEEVQCKNYSRLSINGWFHVKDPLKFDTPMYLPPRDGLYADDLIEPVETDLKLTDYVDDSYLVTETAMSIQQYIEEHSEMSLESYFKENIIDDVVVDLGSNEIKWQRMGPPNRRNYQYVTESSLELLPEKLKTFVTVLRSQVFFEFLNQCTGLELKTMRWEMQKWSPGCYSLLCQENISRLDVMFCLGDVEIVGGKTHYVTLDDEVQTALISTGCEVNILNLVYGDTSRYTSLVSKYSKSSCFYMFMASYFEAGA